MHKPIAGAEDTVAELGKGSPESDLQAMVVLCADGQAGLRIFREANQIADAHIGAAKAVPPKLDKGAPAAALAIRCLHHLIQVAQKARHARHVQDAAQGLAPCLKAAQAARSGRPAGAGPGLAERQASRHKPRAIGAHPDHQVGVAKALTPQGLVAAGIEADAHPGAGDGDGCSNAEANLIDSCPQPVATLNTIIAVAHAGTRTRKGE